MTDRNEYVEKLKTKIDEAEAEMQRLEGKVAEASAEAQAEYQSALDQMREKRDDLKTRLDEAREASDSAFDDMKAGLQSAWQRLSDAVGSAADRFR